MAGGSRVLRHPLRLVVLAFAAVSLLFIYSSNTNVAQQWIPNTANGYQRENATLVTLCRNDDLPSVLESIRSYEDRFNWRYHYDWVFLNNEPFTADFVKLTSNLVSGEAKYGVIPESMWSYPDFINQETARQSRAKLEEEGVLYGGSESYRHMCRFQSGFFYRHELMQDYKYYWRVDGDTKVNCDVPYDVFKLMREEKKSYGFVIAIYEYIKTIPTLWPLTVKFMTEHPQFVAKDNLVNFVSDNGQDYNLCHFWSNFEIADADFLRSPAFEQYFDTLDKSGGFFYERWGDAPVHSLAAVFFLNKDEIHFFEDIGYSHNPYQHVPENYVERGLKCHQIPAFSFDWDGYSCMRQYYRSIGKPLPAGVEPLSS